MTPRVGRAEFVQDEQRAEQPPRSRDTTRSDSSPTRLTVNISPATERALQRVAQNEGVTITEALRRLVSYGDLLYQATRVDGDDVLIRRGQDIERIVLI